MAHSGSLTWTLQVPKSGPKKPYLIIICGDWSYGILPYCGPGTVQELWNSEMEFLIQFSNFLTQRGYYTLSLTCTDNADGPAEERDLIRIAGPSGVLAALRTIDSPVQWSPEQMICIGHGLGGYVHCHLASYGIAPAAFVFAAGVFADYEVLLSQKYIPVIQSGLDMNDIQDHTLSDSISVMLAKNLGVIFHAIRKGKTKVRIESGDYSLTLPLDPLIFTGTQMPRCMFRHIHSPTLILHGSSDLDVSLWNAASIEQSVRRNGIIPERIIIADRDHWFRHVADNPGEQLKERLNGDCFSRPIDNRVFDETVSFIRKVTKPIDIIQNEEVPVNIT